MGHDASAGLSADGWLPDLVTVGALTKVFTPELVDEVLEEVDAVEVRRRSLPSRMVVYFVLALWLFRGRNCGYLWVLDKLVAGQAPDASWRLPTQPGLSKARTRVGPEPLRILFERVAGPLGEPGQPGVFLGGLRMVVIDGATSSLPRDDDNRAEFGGPSNAGGQTPFPQVRWVIMAEAGTQSLLGATFGAYTAAETTLVRALLPLLGPGMLTLADRRYLSYALASEVRATGAHFLWRASASFALRPVAKLRDGSYLAKVRPGLGERGGPMTVRVIEYTVQTRTVGDDGSKETTSELFCLVTDLLDPDEYPMLDLACAYPARWTAEIVIGHHTTDMGRDQPVLRSKGREHVAQEMWALFAVYQGLQRLISLAAGALGAPPDTISFPAALNAAADSVGAAFPP
ncbi:MULTISPECIES: IS4 family transposase [unclassified Frankia]|uniref:IS4 family transposase n=1 Tax=unclassified Frankia TaxID=2632575 RepID=UPI002AD5B470|nr:MULTISPECIES: IS4 family transposase [unclassified Frankia]